MSMVRKRVRRLVLAGALVALFTLFGSSAVGAADFGIAGRLGGDFARGFAIPSTTGGTGTVSRTDPFSFSGGPFSSGVAGVNGPDGAGRIQTFVNGR